MHSAFKRGVYVGAGDYKLLVANHFTKICSDSTVLVESSRSTSPCLLKDKNLFFKGILIFLVCLNSPPYIQVYRTATVACLHVRIQRRDSQLDVSLNSFFPPISSDEIELVEREGEERRGST